MRPIRLGIIGLGNFGRRHAHVCAQVSDIEVVGAADPAGDTTGLPFTTHRSLAELLARGLDAAIVATPPGENLAIARVLAKHHVHTLFEKPLAPTPDDATRIARLFAERGLVAGVGHIERFNPAARALVEAVRNQTLGPLRSLKAVRCGPPPQRSWQLDVGLDLAIHDADLMHWLAGGLQTVETICWQQDRLQATGMLANNVAFSVTADRQLPARTRYLVARCERGQLTANLVTQTVQQHPHGQPQPWPVELPTAHTSPLQREIEGFRDRVLNRPTAEMTPLECGVQAVEFIHRLRKL